MIKGEGNKDKEIKEKLIFFVDERGEEKKIYAVIIEQTASTITFKTKDNIFTIPIYRLIKIKEPIENGEE
jgi:hypothetical protein